MPKFQPSHKKRIRGHGAAGDVANVDGDGVIGVMAMGDVEGGEKAKMAEDTNGGAGAEENAGMAGDACGSSEQYYCGVNEGTEGTLGNQNDPARHRPGPGVYERTTPDVAVSNWVIESKHPCSIILKKAVQGSALQRWTLIPTPNGNDDCGVKFPLTAKDASRPNHFCVLRWAPGHLKLYGCPFGHYAAVDNCFDDNMNVRQHRHNMGNVDSIHILRKEVVWRDGVENKHKFVPYEAPMMVIVALGRNVSKKAHLNQKGEFTHEEVTLRGLVYFPNGQLGGQHTVSIGAFVVPIYPHPCSTINHVMVIVHASCAMYVKGLDVDAALLLRTTHFLNTSGRNVRPAAAGPGSGSAAAGSAASPMSSTGVCTGVGPRGGMSNVLRLDGEHQSRRGANDEMFDGRFRRIIFGSKLHSKDWLLVRERGLYHNDAPNAGKENLEKVDKLEELEKSKGPVGTASSSEPTVRPMKKVQQMNCIHQTAGVGVMVSYVTDCTNIGEVVSYIFSHPPKMWYIPISFHMNAQVVVGIDPFELYVDKTTFMTPFPSLLKFPMTKNNFDNLFLKDDGGVVVDKSDASAGIDPNFEAGFVAGFEAGIDDVGVEAVEAVEAIEEAGVEMEEEKGTTAVDRTFEIFLPQQTPEFADFPDWVAPEDSDLYSAYDPSTFDPIAGMELCDTGMDFKDLEM